VNELADAVLAKVEMERKLSMAKAWEEHEKSKVDNRCHLNPTELN
jgi:hypothetical protein